MTRSPPRGQGGAGPLAQVVPLGKVSGLACSVVAAHLHAVLGLEASVSGAVPIPDEAWLTTRGQVHAGRLLNALSPDLSGARLRVGVTSVDLCLPVLTYVFGEAHVAGRVAVVSTHRLGGVGGTGGAAGAVGAPGAAGAARVGGAAGAGGVPGAGGAAGAGGVLGAGAAAGAGGVPGAGRRAGAADASFVYERLAKVAVHEGAHALGLTHCHYPGCLMRGAPTVEGLDEQGLRFCAACQRALGKALRGL